MPARKCLVFVLFLQSILYLLFEFIIGLCYLFFLYKWNNFYRYELEIGKLYEGTFVVSTTEPKQKEFVLIKGLDKLITIEETSCLHRAIHEDKVVIEILPKSGGGQPRGKLINIAKRNRRDLTGILKRKGVIIYSFLIKDVYSVYESLLDFITKLTYS